MKKINEQKSSVKKLKGIPVKYQKTGKCI